MMDLVLRTTAVFALAFAIAVVLRRATPATRHLLWHITMVIVVAAPLAQPLAPHIELPPLITHSIESTLFPRTLSTNSTSGIRLRSPEAQGELRRDLAEVASGPRRRAIDTLATLSPLFLWTTGFVATALWFALGWLAALWMAGRATRAPAQFELEARAIARELGMKRAPDVRLMTSAQGPLTVGIFHPVILLPSLATTWHPERRRAVFAHELAHVGRGDTRTQALAHIACALYWFNPLAWMAARALRRERERACDDAVIALGVRASSYAQDLLDIAQTMGNRLPSAALAMTRQSELEGRLRSLLVGDRPRLPARATKWALSSVMVVCATVSFGAAPSRQTRALEAMAGVKQPPAASRWGNLNRPHEEQQREQDRKAAQALAQSNDQDVREWAALQLAASGDDSVIGALSAALGDDSGQVREKAALGLALRSSPEVVAPLIRALQDPDAQVREKAAVGLALRRDSRVVDALLRAANDSDAQVREKVAVALGTSGDPRARAPLEAAMRDSDAQVREKAAMGLVLLTSSPMGPIDRRAVESGLSWVLHTVLRAVQ